MAGSDGEGDTAPALDPRVQTRAAGLSVAPAPARDGTGSIAGGDLAPGWPPATARPSAQRDVPAPAHLLTSFMSSCASRAAAAVLSANQVGMGDTEVWREQT